MIGKKFKYIGPREKALYRKKRPVYVLGRTVLIDKSEWYWVPSFDESTGFYVSAYELLNNNKWKEVL